MRDRFARLRNLDNLLGGADTFNLYGAELMRTETVISRGTYTSTTLDKLICLAAEQAQQAGWAAFDAGHTDKALKIWEHSHHAALQGGSEALAANALIHIAYAAPQQGGIEAANAASHSPLTEAAPQTRALLASRHAWSLAIAGDEAGAGTALDAAAAALSLTGPPAPHWAAWIDQTELDIMAGRVWSVLHNHRRAVPILEQALASYPDQWARDKAIYSLHLADAYIDAGDLDQATETTTHAVHLARTVSSVRPITQAKAVIRRLHAQGSDTRVLADLLADR